MTGAMIPAVNSLWRHRNGILYRVTAVTNLPDKPEYPTTVIYVNEETGSLWSRRADDWARSFTPETEE